MTYATLGSQRSNYEEGADQPFNNFSVAATVTWALSDHTIRAGYDMRFQKWELTDDGYLAGRYNFTGAYTSASSSASIQTGQSLAQFLLGIPTSGGNSYIDVNTQGDYTDTVHSLFAQDAWSPTSNLTVNFGLRAEIDIGLREAHNRNITGFDRTTSNPLEPAARAAYAKNPIPEIPVDQFHVRGGLLYGGSPIYDRLITVLPRASVSYLLDQTHRPAGRDRPLLLPLLLRCHQPARLLAVDAPRLHHRQRQDVHRRPQQPVPERSRRSAGLVAGARHVRRARPGVQHHGHAGELERPEVPHLHPLATGGRSATSGPAGWSSSTTSDHGGRTCPCGEISTPCLSSTSRPRATRDAANEAYLSASVPNPFAGLLPNTTLNGKTTTRYQLLRPYPEFLNVAVMEYNGSDSYESGQLTVSKRFESGLSLIATYTHSKATEKVSYLNTFDTQLEERTSPDDRPKRATIGATVPIPVGKGRTWGNGWGKVMEAIFGGWNVSAVVPVPAGFPHERDHERHPDRVGERLLRSHVRLEQDLKIGPWARRTPTARSSASKYPPGTRQCFYFHDAAVQTNGVDDPAKQRADPRINIGNGARYFPTILDNMRMPALHLLDIGLSKTFDFSGGVVSSRSGSTRSTRSTTPCGGRRT